MTADWNPDGLDTSASFRAYVDVLREESSFGAPKATECARDHGRSADTRPRDPFRTMKATQQSADVQEPNIPPAHDTEFTRRRTMQMTGAALASLAMMGAASANVSSELNFASDFVPNPEADATATIGESSASMGVLDYYDDSGNVQTLADSGATVAQRDEDMNDDEPFNPVSLMADHIAASAYHAYPRGETYDDGDDEDADVSALDAEHWTEDGGSIALTDQNTPAGETGLNVYGNPADGSETVGTFADSELTSGVDRTYIQVGYTVNTLAAGASVHFRVSDGAGNSKSVQIADGGNTDDMDVIGTGDEMAAIRQVEIGDLAGDLDEIQEVEIAVADGEADVDLFAFNAERSSRWGFGTREYLDVGEEEDEEDELDTETVYEPDGWYSVVEYGALPDWVTDAPIHDLQVDTTFRGESIALAYTDYMWAEADRYNEEWRFHFMLNFDFPASHDLDLDIGNVRAEQLHPSERYLHVETENGDHDPYTVSDATDDEDGDMDGNNITGSFDGTIGDEVTITEAATQGRTTSIYYDIRITADERDQMEVAEEPSGGFGSGGREGSGIVGSIFSVPGMIVSGVLGFISLRWLGVLPGMGD